MIEKTRIISDFEEFRSLRNEWNNLLDEIPESGIWLRHEWYECWWRAFGQGARLFLLVIEEQGQLKAVMPLMIISTPIKGIRHRVLRFIENGITPRSKAMLPRFDNEQMHAFWRTLIENRREWDFAILSNVAHDDPGFVMFRSFLSANQLQYVEQPDRMSPFIRIDDSNGAIRTQFGKRLKRNLSNARNRLERAGGFSVVKCSTRDQVATGLDQAFMISSKSWKGQSGKDIGGNRQRSQFYREIAVTFVDSDQVRIWLLMHNDRAIAFEYALIDKDHLLLFAIDYDLDFAKYSPGAFLRSLVIDQIAASGLTVYDFAGTNYDYKLQWTHSVRPHSQFWLFHSGLKSRLLYFIKAKVLPALKRSEKTHPAEPEADSNGEE